METTSKRWWTLTAGVLGGAMVGLDGTATTIAAPYISASAGATLGQLELIANAYLVALALGLLPAGRLADRIGRRRTFVIGVLGFGAASLGIALSDAVWSLIFFRILQGLAGALLQPAALALVRAAFPADKLGLPLGIWGGANALAIGLGPVLAGVVVESFGWQAVFAVNVPVALITVVLAWIFVAESRGIPGSGRVRWLLSSRAVSVGTILVAVSSFGVFGLLFLLTLYLQNVRGLSPVTAGVWMLGPTCVVVLSAPIGGLLAQRFGPRWPVSSGLLMVACGLIGLSFLDTRSSFAAVLSSGALAGFGTGLCVIAATEAIMGACPDSATGSASALQQVASQAGGVLGIVATGAILTWQVTETLPERVAQVALSYRDQYALLGASDAVSQGFAPRVSAAARTTAHLTFTNAMSTALLLAAVIALAGAGLALLLPRPPAPAPLEEQGLVSVAGG